MSGEAESAVTPRWRTKKYGGQELRVAGTRLFVSYKSGRGGHGSAYEPTMQLNDNVQDYRMGPICTDAAEARQRGAEALRDYLESEIERLSRALAELGAVDHDDVEAAPKAPEPARGTRGGRRR